MKEVKIKTPVVNYIPAQTDKYSEEIVYETSDGERFKEYGDASIHESELKLDKAEKIFFWFPMIDDSWYKAKDEEELQFLKDHLSKSYGNRYGENKLKVGEWFTVSHKNRDLDGKPVDHFVPLSKLKESYEELLKLLGE